MPPKVPQVKKPGVLTDLSRSLYLCHVIDNTLYLKTTSFIATLMAKALVNQPPITEKHPMEFLHRGTAILVVVVAHRHSIDVLHMI